MYNGSISSSEKKISDISMVPVLFNRFTNDEGLENMITCVDSI